MLIILISFPSGGCVDDVNIQKVQECAGVEECAYWVIQKTVFNVYICLNRSSRYKHNKLEKCHEKPRHQKAVFSKFRQFSYLRVFREQRKCLTCSFC